MVCGGVWGCVVVCGGVWWCVGVCGGMCGGVVVMVCCEVFCGVVVMW